MQLFPFFFYVSVYLFIVFVSVGFTTAAYYLSELAGLSASLLLLALPVFPFIFVSCFVFERHFRGPCYLDEEDFAICNLFRSCPSFARLAFRRLAVPVHSDFPVRALCLLHDAEAFPCLLSHGLSTFLFWAA